MGRPSYCSRSEEHTSELQSQSNLVCRLLLEKKKHTSELQSQSNLVCRIMLEKKNEFHTPCSVSFVTLRFLLVFHFLSLFFFFFFFLNDPAPPEISPLPLHAALPICGGEPRPFLRQQVSTDWGAVIGKIPGW